MLCLHLGLPKTGTTWLQERILPKVDGLNVIYKKFMPEFSYAMHRFLLHGEWQDQIDVPRLCELIESGPSIFTDENVSISMQGIWTGKGFRPDHVAKNIPRLAAELGDCKIRALVTLRRQDTWLISRYAESAKKRKEPGQEEFEQKVEKVLLQNSRAKRWLLFDQVHEALTSVCGSDEVLFVCQEQFIQEPEKTVEKVCEFLGVEVPDTPALTKTHVNRLSLNERAWRLKSWDDRSVELNADLSNRIRSHFEASNRAFSRLSGLDLDVLGYYPS